MPTPGDFSDVRLGKPVSEHGAGEQTLGAGGDFGYVANAPVGPAVPMDSYPNIRGYGYDPTNSQFSSDKSSTWQEQSRETEQAQNSFADLQQHLNNSLDTLGSRVAHPQDKPWTPPAGEGK